MLAGNREGLMVGQQKLAAATGTAASASASAGRCIGHGAKEPWDGLDAAAESSAAEGDIPCTARPAWTCVTRLGHFYACWNINCMFVRLRARRGAGRSSGTLELPAGQEESPHGSSSHSVRTGKAPASAKAK